MDLAPGVVYWHFEGNIACENVQYWNLRRNLILEEDDPFQGEESRETPPS